MSLSLLWHILLTILQLVFIICIGGVFLIIAALIAQIMWAMFMEEIYPSLRNRRFLRRRFFSKKES